MEKFSDILVSPPKEYILYIIRNKYVGELKEYLIYLIENDFYVSIVDKILFENFFIVTKPDTYTFFLNKTIQYNVNSKLIHKGKNKAEWKVQKYINKIVTKIEIIELDKKIEINSFDEFITAVNKTFKY